MIHAEPPSAAPLLQAPPPAAPPLPPPSLHAAVQLDSKHACLAALYACLAAGEDVNAPDEYGRCPLHLAAGYNTGAEAVAAAVKALVDAGADVAAPSAAGGQAMN